MLIRFWCDSEITFSRGLHKNLVTVLYFSIINVLCGAGEDASFAPQANLVSLLIYLTYQIECMPCLSVTGHPCGYGQSANHAWYLSSRSSAVFAGSLQI